MKYKTINFIKKYSAGVLGLLLALSLIVMSVPAQSSEQMNEGRKEARDATKVFRTIMNKPDKAIPRELLERAHAVGVFPNVVKAAFVFGGRGGDGVVARRTADGSWSAPVFYNMGGASFGAQIGAKSTDYIILFMNEGALRDLLDDKLEFEGDLSFAAGPVGRTIGAGTNPTLDAGILTYSRSKGAFIGASIKGAVLTADNSVNEAIYKMKAGEILENPKKANTNILPRELRDFINTLALYGGTKMMSSTNDSRQSEATMISASYSAQNADSNSMLTKNRQPLERAVRRELLTMPYYSVFDWIEFDIDRSGAVTLRGSVITPPDKKSSAERRVKDIEGVSRVINNIEILPVSPNDERLREALYREIYSGPLFRYQVGALQQIHIIVNGGKATLKGVVDSEADKNFAGIRAKTVSGVFSVDNQLVVADGRSL